MSFDARSRERLEALGRQLPKPLPLPEPARPRPDAPRHAVEIEQDPEQLFRELMAASADGSVPPHLMDRLRELEQARRLQTRDRVQAGGSGSASGGANRPRPGSSPRGSSGGSVRPGPNRPRNAEEEALYTAFQQLLLEDDEEAL
ncbi:MAG: hypothetical protein WCI65_10275 [Synechococcaceae cyanobacterium ELA263]